MEQFKEVICSKTIQQDNNNIIETTGFNKKNDNKRIKCIALCIIKCVVAVGLFGVFFVAVYLFYHLYSKEEIRKFIPKIIEWAISAFSGIGLLSIFKKLAKWFKN